MPTPVPEAVAPTPEQPTVIVTPTPAQAPAAAPVSVPSYEEEYVPYDSELTEISEEDYYLRYATPDEAEAGEFDEFVEDEFAPEATEEPPPRRERVERRRPGLFDQLQAWLEEKGREIQDTLKNIRV